MLKAAYMYKTYGGGDRFHTCGQCEYFAQPDKQAKIYTCIRHPELPDWRADWMACKGGKFNDAGEDAREDEQEKEKNNVQLCRKNAKTADKNPDDGSRTLHQIDLYEWLEAEGMA